MTSSVILARTQHWLAVSKPAGIPVIPGRDEAGEGKSLVEQLQDELQQKLWIVHRLDRDTTGVLLFALDAATHRTLSMAFEGGRIEKTYLALARGDLAEPKDVQVALAPARRGRMRPCKPGEAGKSARTLIRPIERFPSARATLVEAVPLTGRTHQIRVHLLCLGHPLLYDHQYGQKEPVTSRALGGAADDVVLARTPLHAARLRFAGLEGLADTTLEAPLPSDMQRALDLLRSA